MAWIEVHQNLSKHPKLLHLSRDLGEDRLTTLGRMVLLWCWALDVTRDGTLRGVTCHDLAAVMDWGQPADQLLTALIRDGWIDQRPDGVLCLHDWEEYTGSLMARREANKERARKFRQSNVTRTEPLRNAVTEPPVTRTEQYNMRDVTRTEPLRNAHITRTEPTKPDGQSHVTRTEQYNTALPDPTGPDPTGPNRTGPEEEKQEKEVAAVAELTIPVTEITKGPDTKMPEKNAYAVFEENIGVINPLVADELSAAVKLCGDEIVMRAIREAALHNHRSWKYISAILENWQSQGRSGPSPPGRRGAREAPDWMLEGLK